MTELTFKEFCNLPFNFCYGNSGDGYDRRQFRNFEHDIGLEIYTKFDLKTCKWGKPNIVWFLPNDTQNFKTIDQVYVAYMEKACKGTK